MPFQVSFHRFLLLSFQTFVKDPFKEVMQKISLLENLEHKLKENATFTILNSYIGLCAEKRKITHFH
jgi:hypothetical protein